MREDAPTRALSSPPPEESNPCQSRLYRLVQRIELEHPDAAHLIFINSLVPMLNRVLESGGDTGVAMAILQVPVDPDASPVIIGLNLSARILLRCNDFEKEDLARGKLTLDSLPFVRRRDDDQYDWERLAHRFRGGTTWSDVLLLESPVPPDAEPSPDQPQHLHPVRVVVTYIESSLYLLTFLEDQAKHDDLVHSVLRLSEAKQRARRILHSGLPFVSVFFDFDDFGQVNKLHGHDAANAALIEFGKVLTSHLKDAEQGSFAYRFGGDEFGCVLLIPATENLPASYARRWVTKVAEDMEHRVIPSRKKPFSIRLSWGMEVVHSEHGHLHPEFFTAAAQQCMERKKRKKRVQRASGE